MKLYLDTEFNGYRGQLISMALVDEKGEFWYKALPVPYDVDAWVLENVISVLDTESVGLRAFQQSLRQFLRRYDCIHVIADWPEDIQHFCWALITGPGERIDTPILTLEVRRDLNTDKSRIPHNALADAQALKRHADSL